VQVSDVERRTVAFHECGHALVGCMSPEVVRSTVTKISIVPRGSGALGYTLNEPQEDRYLQGEDDIRSFITVALAGRAAERLIFGRLTSGASDDLQVRT
jgi:cell division protease FtsH